MPKTSSRDGLVEIFAQGHRNFETMARGWAYCNKWCVYDCIEYKHLRGSVLPHAFRIMIPPSEQAKAKASPHLGQNKVMEKWILRQCIAVTFVRLLYVLLLKVVVQYMYFPNEPLDLLLAPCAGLFLIRDWQLNIVARHHHAAREVDLGHAISYLPRAHINSLVSNR